MTELLELPTVEAPEIAEPETATGTPDAPYGYLADGVTPRKRRPYKRGGGSRAGAKSGVTIDVQSVMTDQYVGLGILAAMTGRPELAVTILGKQRYEELLQGGPQTDGGVADQAGAAWARLAETNPAWRKRIERFTSTSAGIQLIGAHMPMIAAFMVNPPKMTWLQRFALRRRVRKSAGPKPQANGGTPVQGG